jgi:hypothetical protein
MDMFTIRVIHFQKYDNEDYESGGCTLSSSLRIYQRTRERGRQRNIDKVEKTKRKRMRLESGLKSNSK